YNSTDVTNKSKYKKLPAKGCTLASVSIDDDINNAAVRMVRNMRKDMAGKLQLNLLGFHQAVTTIRQRYFDGEEIMFSDSVKTLSDLETFAEELIREFNGRVAKLPEDKLELEVLRTV